MTQGSEATPTPLVLRLVSDAEARAAAGGVREALVLLRWASRICPDAVLPVVLLAYHRVRATHLGATAAPHPPVGGMPPYVRREVEAARDDGGRVRSDALGFPVPRFPTAPPSIDAGFFVPAPRRLAVHRAGPTETASRATPAARRTMLAPVLLAAAAAVFLAPQAGPVLSRLRSHAGLEEPGAMAMRSGEPRRALAETTAPARTPRVLLVRGRAFLALGDSADALACLDSAAAHPQASAEDGRQAAELLGGVPGGEQAAADAYLLALEAGLTREHWGAAADALERAGRPQQARRLRTLLE